MTLRNSTTKWCRSCGETKPIGDFSPKDGRGVVFSPDCKACRTAILCEQRRIIREANRVEREVKRIPDDIGPDDRVVTDGFDWTWAFAIFREIDGFPDYRVASYGAVWSKRVFVGNPDGQWRRLKECPRGDKGHVGVKIANGFKIEAVGLHRIVAEAFLPSRPPGMMCLHNNGNPKDNRIVNLRWGTHKDNTADSMEHGTFVRGSRKNCTKLTEADIPEIRQLHRQGWTIKAIAIQFNIDRSVISRILSGQFWAHVPDE